ncbi:MAG: TonB family protein [Terriglobales bacterium]
MSYQSLLFCPDDKTARVVTQVLTELEFTVELCNEPFATVKRLMAKQYDAIVVDCDNEQNAALLFKSARNSTSNQTSLAVAVVEGQVGVAKAFRIGANLVLTKPVNVEQSKGTLRVARGLLRKAAAGAPLQPTSAPLSPTGAPKISMPAAAMASPSARVPRYAPNSANVASLSSSKVTVPTASSSTFEVEEDRVPEPDSGEAAFLASIPQIPASKATSQAATPPAHTESPWMQLPRPAAGNKLSPPALESAGKPDSSQSTERHSGPSAGRRPFNGGLASSHGATAVAPAMETARASKISEDALAKLAKNQTPSLPEVEPLAANIDLPQNVNFKELSAFVSAPEEPKRSKTPTIAALIVIAIAAAVYFGWTRMQTGTKAPVQQAAPVMSQAQPPSAAIPAPAALPAIDTKSTLTASEAQPLPKLDQNPEPPASAASRKSQPDEIVVIENTDAATQPKPLSVKKAPEPLAVKAPAVEMTVAPPPLQAEPDASGKTIARLITSTYSAVPTRAPELLRVSQGISQGMLLKKVNPVYPSQALQMHKEGTVQILARITKTGAISSAKVIKGDPILAQAALTAVRQWKYAPYTLDGQPVEVQTQISIEFKHP